MKKYSSLKESVEVRNLEVSFDFVLTVDQSISACLKTAITKAIDAIHHNMTEELFMFLSEKGFETVECKYNKDKITMVFDKTYRYGLTIWLNQSSFNASGDAYNFYLSSYNKADNITADRMYSDIEPLDGYGMGKTTDKSFSLNMLNDALKQHESAGKF